MFPHLNRPWSWYGLLAGLGMNVPDIFLLACAVAGTDPRMLDAACVAHGLLAAACFLMTTASEARTGATLTATTEGIKSGAYWVLSQHDTAAAWLLLLVGIAAQVRMVAALRMYQGDAQRL